MPPNKSLFAIIFLTLLHYICGDCSMERRAMHYESKLEEDLLCAYESGFRPVKDHRDAVNVSVRFSLKYISFYESEDTITIHSYVAMKWNDVFLSWDPSDYGNITELQIESLRIWTPRMSLYNSDGLNERDRLFTTCLVKNDGNVSCVPYVSYNSICRTSLLYWPYDEQNCTLYFGSWMHSGEMVNFNFYNKNPIMIDNFEEGPGWSLERIVRKRLPGKVAANESYPMLKLTFVLKRHAKGLAAMFVVPSVVATVLTITSLLLDVKHNTRLALQVFSLLSYFTVLSEIGNTIPRHGLETPVLVFLVRDCLAVALAAVVSSLMLMNLRKKVDEVPQWLKSVSDLVSTSPVRYLVITDFDRSDVEPNDRLSVNSDWVQVANILNSAMFIIFIIVYTIVFSVNIPRDN